MPGVVSGLNHSLEIQACGRIRSPFCSSSPCSARRHSSSQVPSTVTLRSLRRSWRSSSSGNEAQGNRDAMAPNRVGTTVTMVSRGNDGGKRAASGTRPIANRSDRWLGFERRLLVERHLPVRAAADIAGADQGMVLLAVAALGGGFVADDRDRAGRPDDALARHRDIPPAAVLSCRLGDMLPIEQGRHFGEDRQALLIGMSAVALGAAGPELPFDVIELIFENHGKASCLAQNGVQTTHSPWRCARLLYLRPNRRSMSASFSST